MKLTKYEHACFTIENDGQCLVVDPGNFTTDFVPPDNVTAVVVTHQHPDHFDPELIAEIFAKNDGVTIIGPSEVTDTIKIENKRSVDANERVTIGAFDLEFFGGVHALIHDSLPRPQNLGVMINQLVYYPGDSFAVPTSAVDTLVLPAAAPWLKISESIDFFTKIRPRLALPTHDAILSDVGKELVDRLLDTAAAGIDGCRYCRLDHSIDI